MKTNSLLRACTILGITAASTSFVLTPPSTWAQAVSSNGGSISGSVTDPSGAVVPDASVEVRNPDTGFSKVITSDSRGFYSIGPLIPGNYTVRVTRTGFQTVTTNTTVNVGTVTPGSVRLTLGQSSEVIEVTAGALQVNTDQIAVSDVITRQQIETLPINGRNILDVAQIAPGVILQSGETFDPTKSGYSAISVGGVSGRTTRILLDGQDITDETVGTTIFNVTTGAVDEFQLNRSTQDVSGEVTSTGQVLVSTRSGTNTLHGQLFGQFQDHRVGFARTTGGFDAPFQRNQFGGSIGGPILRDKLFFFANSERIKQDSQGSATLSPTFASIQKQFPFIPAPFRDTYSTARMDYNGPRGAHLFARAIYEVNSAAGNFGDQYSLFQSRNNTPAIAGGLDFNTGKFTHSLRGGYEKFHNVLGDGTAGLTSIYNPLKNVTLIGPVFAGPNFLAPQGTFQSDKQIRYDGTWTVGAHTVKFGTSLNRILGGGFAAFYGPSLYTIYNNGSALANCKGAAGAAPCLSDPINGYSAALYVLGNGNGLFTEKPAFGLSGGGTFDWRSGAYLADTWKVTPSFTMTAGLRYSVDTGRANQDLPTPLCSSVDPGLQFTGCSGNTPLFDQFRAGLGKQTHQPYGNFGPQLGFVYSPGRQKTSIRGGAGIYYESDVFNNTTNARSSVVNSPGQYFNYTTVCGGTYQVLLPGGGSVSSVNGVPLKTICSQSIAQAAPQINQLKAQFQAASQKPGANPGYIGTGGGLRAGGLYAGPYLTPYSIQISGGVQHEIKTGLVVSADFVHNATLKVPLLIDVNHVGAARFLNAANARTAISATTLGFGCAGGTSAAAINCAIGQGATIADFAGNGLDSGNQYTGGYPGSAFGVTPAAFAGANTNVGLGQFVLPVGRSGYDALQVVLRQQLNHPVPGIVNGNLQISYNLSRSVNPVGGANNADQFFNNVPYDQDNPNLYIGRSGLDHTNELNMGGNIAVKYGLRVALIGHFYSAAATSLRLDNTSGQAGEIFRTDVTGDGTTGDLVPGTNPGDYMHAIKGRGLNALINRYNATMANTPTPAGVALVNAGLFTTGQLQQLGAVQPMIALPETTPENNPAFRSLDTSFSYPITLARVREGLSLEPGVSIYNVGNFSNFGGLSGVLTGGVGSLNGKNNPAVQDSGRVQRGSGTFAQGSPRTTEFQLKLNF